MRRKLLRTYRVRYSKLVSKKLIVQVTKNLRHFVHKDPADPESVETKLVLMRHLHCETEDDNLKKMLQNIQSHVVQALVAYAGGSKDSTAQAKPYGLLAARSTAAFKSLPTVTLALTFAEIYQAVRVDQHLYKSWTKKSRPNISSVWPRGTMLRYLKLQKAFYTQKKAVFAAYEALGGTYMGDEPPSSKKSAVRFDKSLLDLDQDFE